jgi:hypothetical protein
MGRPTKKIIPKYDVRDPNDFSELIFFLDSYRVLQYTEFAYIEKMVNEGRLGNRFKEDWDSIKKLLTKMATLPRDMRHLIGLAKIQQIMNFISNITYPLVLLLLAVLFFMTWGRNFESTRQITSILGYVSVPIIATILTAKIVPIFIGKRISDELRRHREKNLERYQTYENQIKNIVQELINSLSYELKKRARSNKENRLIIRVFNTDYYGIRIIRGQSWFRKFYEVELAHDD